MQALAVDPESTHRIEASRLMSVSGASVIDWRRNVAVPGRTDHWRLRRSRRHGGAHRVWPEARLNGPASLGQIPFLGMGPTSRVARIAYSPGVAPLIAFLKRKEGAKSRGRFLDARRSRPRGGGLGSPAAGVRLGCQAASGSGPCDPGGPRNVSDMAPGPHRDQSGLSRPGDIRAGSRWPVWPQVP